MTIVCNIWMICLELNWFVYDPSWMLHLSVFLWTLQSLVLVVFNNFLLIDATDRSNIFSNQKRFFIALSLYPLSFFANTPLKTENWKRALPPLFDCHCGGKSQIWVKVVCSDHIVLTSQTEDIYLSFHIKDNCKYKKNLYF